MIINMGFCIKLIMPLQPMLAHEVLLLDCRYVKRDLEPHEYANMGRDPSPALETLSNEDPPRSHS